MSKQLLLLDSTGKRVSASIEDVVASKLNNFKGWTCYTGIQSLYIDFDGHVWVGNCAGGVGKHYLKKSLPAWGHLGHIDSDFLLPKTTVTCPYSGCGCGSDIVVTKYNKNNKSAENFIFDTNKEYDSDIENISNIVASKLQYPIEKQILWDIGRRCNYNCSYCWPDVHNLSDPHKSYETFKKTADYVIDKWSNGNQIRWYFGGGEPTLNPAFEPFIDYLASKNQWTMLVTNSSQGPSYWAKNANNYNILIFSAHFEFMKPELFSKNFDKVAEILSSNPSRLEKLIIKLMTKPGMVDSSTKFVDSLKESKHYSNAKHKISFDMVPIRGNEGYNLNSDYSDRELLSIIEFNKNHV